MDAQGKVAAGNEGRTDWKSTMELWAFTALRSPLIFFVRPRVTHYDGDTVTLRVSLNRRNRNPFGSMYFGSLSTGAEVIPGIFSIKASRELNIRTAFYVREFTGSFLSRADGDVFFHCEEGPVIRNLIQRSSETGQGQQVGITVNAFTRSEVPGTLFGSKVAQFDLIFYVKALE